MESCSCGKYQYGDEAKLPDPAWQYVKEGIYGYSLQMLQMWVFMV